MLNPRTPLARTPLHHWHIAHGARFREVDGWQNVAAYTSSDREVEAAHAGLGLADISAFAKASLRGTAEKTAHRVDALQTASGRWLRCCLTADHLLLLASKPGSATSPPVASASSEVTSAYAGFVVLGPRLEDFLSRLTHLDVRLASFPMNSCAETALARVEALLVRAEEFALPSMRIYVAWDLGEYVWERLMEAGSDCQIAPLGLDALAQLSVAVKT